MPRDDRTIDVVGVAGDVRYEDIEAEPKPAIFFPVAQMKRSRAMLFVRTAGDPASLANAVRNAVRAVDRNHTVSDVQTLRHCMYEATARDRFATQVLSAFAVTALLLAAIGIYGVLSLAVAQRRRELGIRMALGAERGGVLAMILGQAMSMAAAGGVHWRRGRAVGRAGVRQHALRRHARPTRSRTCVWVGAGRRGVRGGDRPGCACHAGAPDGRVAVRLVARRRLGQSVVKARTPNCINTAVTEDTEMNRGGRGGRGEPYS